MPQAPSQLPNAPMRVPLRSFDALPAENKFVDAKHLPGLKAKDMMDGAMLGVAKMVPLTLQRALQ